MGTVIAGRNRPEVEDLIGFFVNTLGPARRPDRTGHFSQLLADTRETTLAAYGHQDLPFEKLVEELDPDRSLSHTPLFQVMFVFQNLGEVGMDAEGLEWNELSFDRDTSRFDLEFDLFPGRVESGRFARLQHRSLRRDNHPPPGAALSGL